MRITASAISLNGADVDGRVVGGWAQRPDGEVVTPTRRSRDAIGRRIDAYG